MRVSAETKGHDVDVSSLMTLSRSKDNDNDNDISAHFFDDIPNLEAAIVTPNVDRILSLMRGRMRMKWREGQGQDVSSDTGAVNPWDGSYTNAAPAAHLGDGCYDSEERIEFTDSCDSYESCIDIGADNKHVELDKVTADGRGEDGSSTSVDTDSPTGDIGHNIYELVTKELSPLMAHAARNCRDNQRIFRRSSSDRGYRTTDCTNNMHIL